MNSLVMLHENKNSRLIPFKVYPIDNGFLRNGKSRKLVSKLNNDRFLTLHIEKN